MLIWKIDDFINSFWLYLTFDKTSHANKWMRKKIPTCSQVVMNYEFALWSGVNQVAFFRAYQVNLLKAFIHQPIVTSYMIYSHLNSVLGKCFRLITKLKWLVLFHSLFTRLDAKIQQTKIAVTKIALSSKQSQCMKVGCK